MVTSRKKQQTKKPTKVERAAAIGANGFWLAARMEKAGVSAQELAEHLRIERQTVWKWQVGLAEPDNDARQRIAAYLKITEPELWKEPGFIDLNAAAAHIKDEKTRLALAKMLQAHPPSED